MDTLPPPAYKGLTMLHLSAALGFRNLIDVLQNWRLEMPGCRALQSEVATKCLDDNNCVPMVRLEVEGTHWNLQPIHKTKTQGLLVTIQTKLRAGYGIAQ